MTETDKTYPEGLKTLNDRFNSRRKGFVYYKENLPDLDCDLEALATRIVPETATSRQADEPTRKSTWARKRREIAVEFVGNSELAYLNAKLIANLRRTSFPDQTPALFQRIWAEQSAHLIGTLSMRWLVSSVITFADHGATDRQRQVGQALRMLFGMMKLYEFERLHSGNLPDEPWHFSDRRKAPLPLDMEPFSLKAGGLDASLIAPVWNMALLDPVIAPLADHLLTALNEDSNGLFRRLATMRQTRAIAKAER